MAFIMSLFSDAEMMGAASGAASSSASMCAADSVAGPKLSAPRADAPAPSAQVLSEPAPPQVVEVIARLGSDSGCVLNPCVKCHYRYLCDDDDCAMKCYPVDMNHAPTAWGWEEFGI